MEDSKQLNLALSTNSQTPPMTPVARPKKSTNPEMDSLQMIGSPGPFSLDRRTTDLLEFRETLDYTINKKNLLGSGLWSDVYMAQPALSKISSTAIDIDAHTPGVDTPPLTPVKAGNTPSSIPPQAYAIKIPATTSAKAVLASEARILSRLASFPGHLAHIVPFFGLDTRNGALIMKAMHISFESFVMKNLNTLSEPSRAALLAESFPAMALNLVHGLEWLDAHHVVHADIKPANILLSSDNTPVFADFSSSILTTPSSVTDAKPSAPFGGGTWDFLCPSILTRDPATSRYPAPSTTTDLYSLALTLLFVVIGRSPFDAAGNNVFRRRDMVKQGSPLAFAFGGDDGAVAAERCEGLSAALRWDVVAWLQEGLRKVGRRARLREWREGLERRVV